MLRVRGQSLRPLLVAPPKLEALFLNTSTYLRVKMGSNTSKEEPKASVEQPVEEDDEPDEW
jgi:hypothetical protein